MTNGHAAEVISSRMEKFIKQAHLSYPDSQRREVYLRGVCEAIEAFKADIVAAYTLP